MTNKLYMPQSYSGDKSQPAQLATYHSYLLRFWEERGEGAGVWRFMLEEPQTGNRWGYADLDGLMAWLRSCMDGASERQFREDKHR